MRATLREIADERKLRFDVEVTEGERTIGVGTHERRVIEVGAVKAAARRRVATAVVRARMHRSPSVARR